MCYKYVWAGLVCCCCLCGYGMHSLFTLDNIFTIINTLISLNYEIEVKPPSHTCPLFKIDIMLLAVLSLIE